MHSTRHTPRTTSLVRMATLTVCGLLLLFAMAPSIAAQGNAGTVKIQNLADLGQHSNDPMPGCTFYVEGFGMAAASGTLVIDEHAPTGSANVISTNWTADDDAMDTFPDHHFLNGPYTLPGGHYKLFVSDVQHEKMKVFTVDCEPPCDVDCDPCATNCTTSPETNGTVTTQVPVFPTAMAAGLAAVGALAGSVLLLRRRS